MLENYLVQTCYKVTTTRNSFGDYINSSNTAIKCRFRYIDSINRSAGQELNSTDAMLWVASDSGIVKGDLILFDSLYYQVEKINKARRLGEDAVQFIKCDLKINQVAVS